MQEKKSSVGLATVLAVLGVSLLLGSRCAGSDPEYVIHSFHPQGKAETRTVRSRTPA
jgi:hypothetical protein